MKRIGTEKETAKKEMSFHQKQDKARLLQMYDDQSLRDQIVYELTMHLQSEETAQRWMADALHFCELFLKKSGSYPLGEIWSGYDEDLILNEMRISVEDLKTCLGFRDDRHEDILFTFRWWNKADWVPNLLNLKGWIEDELIYMWFENESVKFIAGLFGDDP